MLRQYSLSLKTNYYLRLGMFLVMIALNVVFAALGLIGIWSTAGKIVAVTFSSIFFCVWLVTSIISDYETAKSVYTPPKGYHLFLAPVPAWKILLGRIAAILTWDVTGFIIGVFGITVQSFILADVSFSKLFEIRQPVWIAYFLILGLLQFVLMLLVIFLMAALTKSIFYSFKGRSLFGIGSGLLIAYVLHLLNLILMPFTTVNRHGMTLALNITSHNGFAAAVYLGLTFVKIAAVFYITSYLMERRINV